MPKTVVIVDYGVGNILSVARAFEKCGVNVKIATCAKEIMSASRLVLPGVGAFGDCVGKLRSLGLDDAIYEFAAAARPLMGICVGMQMLFDRSIEFGDHKGLAFFPGVVVPIQGTDDTGCRLKVPHIGWAALCRPENHPTRWNGTALSTLKDGSSAYFVHSFHGILEDPSHCCAYVTYGDVRITAAISKENIFGTQFHPEKSGEAGLKIVKAFVDLT